MGSRNELPARFFEESEREHAERVARGCTCMRGYLWGYGCDLHPCPVASTDECDCDEYKARTGRCAGCYWEEEFCKRGELALAAIDVVAGYYPTDIFPEAGESKDCETASWTRHILSLTKERVAEAMGLEREAAAEHKRRESIKRRGKY